MDRPWNEWFDLTLPLENAVAAFTVVLAVMLLAPLLFNRLRMPGIVGLILAGVALGPYGFNIIDSRQITLFSKAGLLYIMFLAGLELNLQEFRKGKPKASSLDCSPSRSLLDWACWCAPRCLASIISLRC